MIHNDVLRSVRYMLDISDNKVVEIIKLGGMDVTKDDLVTYLKKDEEEGFVFCPDEVMAQAAKAAGAQVLQHIGLEPQAGLAARALGTQPRASG